MDKVGRKFYFAPLPTIVVVVMTVILVNLGVWQTERAQEKRQLLDSYRAAPALPPVSLSDMGADWRQYHYRKILLHGAYDSERQLLLENQVRQGILGYMVLTPLHVASLGQAVLVNRGWIAKEPAFAALPEIAVSNEGRTVTGLIAPPPGVGIKMGSLDDSIMSWPKPAPYVDLDWMALQLGKPMLPWVVLLDTEQADGYHRDWQPAVKMGYKEHQGYAFLWFSLAITLVVLFVFSGRRLDDESGPVAG